MKENLYEIINIELLNKYLKSSDEVKGSIKDKDVILLVGQTGAGKTTTIHYLDGREMFEVNDIYYLSCC